MTGPRILVEVLGPTRVVIDGRPVVVHRALERGLLVRLVWSGGVTVPAGQLVEGLWAEPLTPATHQRLRTLVSRLRSRLGPAGELLMTMPGGYRLAGTLARDLADAKAMAGSVWPYHGRSSGPDLERIAGAMGNALSCWRGDTLADLRGLPFAEAQARRLDEWRLELTVRRMTAEVRLGRGSAVVGDLRALVADHPFHEEVHALLAHALYASGRQAEALALLAGLRSRLAEGLGIDLATTTAEMELRILRQDPALATPDPVRRPVRAPALRATLARI